MTLTPHPRYSEFEAWFAAKVVDASLLRGITFQVFIQKNSVTQFAVELKCFTNASCLAAGLPSSMNLQDRTFLRALGEAIRQRRLDANLTQAEFAEKCGLHRTFIGSIERGERNLSILNLRLVARVLRTPLSELLMGLR